LPLLALFRQPIDIYIAVGNEGITPTEIPRNMEVDASLLADKIMCVENNNINVHFEYLPLENHGTILHQAVSNAFRVLYPKENKE
jgi:predicted alpha/beta superfamily hydrolase